MTVRIESHAEPIPGYRLIERLGGGGFGEVWKAEAPGGLLKAIKFVYGDLQEAGEEGQRAEQELKALSRVKTVRHPYILSLERYDIIDGQLLIVMELADRNLWDRFKESRAQGLPGIPREELLGYVEETAEALDLMNTQYQLQHLDIKPQNLFLVHQHVKVADFGLVKDLEGMRASVTGGVTPVYAAPETFEGWVSRYSDQYSLAIVYQELLTGQRPFVGNNVRHLVLQHIQGTPNLSALPAEEQRIIARALSKVPDDRFPSCRDLVKALRNAERGTRGQGPSSVPRPEFRAPTAEEDTGSDSGEPPTARLSHLPPPVPRGAVVPPSSPQPGPAPGEPLPPGPGDSGTGLTRWLRGQRDERGPRPGPAEQEAAGRAAGANPAAGTSPAGGERKEVTGDGCLFPALVIGLGRCGLLVLQELREALCQRFGSLAAVPNLRLLLLDTDPEVLRLATRGSDTGRGLSTNEMLLAPLHRPAHYLKPRDGRPPIESWFNPRMLYRIPRTQVTNGVRALGRLAFCDNYRGISRRLRAELADCLDVPNLEAAARQTGLGLRSSRPRVYVIAGLAGGTGSGMFLDLAYVVREQLRQLGCPQPDLVGLLLLPAVDDPRPRTLPLGNACAALAELNHFGTPGNAFTAKYHEAEPALNDPNPPFNRCVVLPCPPETDAAGNRELACLAGEYLFRDLCSPLGRAADLARAGLSAPAWTARGQFCQTFGLYKFTSPQHQVVRKGADRLCRRLVLRWMSRDTVPVRPAVEAWVRELCGRDEWSFKHLHARLEAAARQTLGRAPEEAREVILAECQAALELADPSRGEGGRGKQVPRELDPAPVRRALSDLEKLFGQPESQETLGSQALLPEALRDHATQLVAEWGQRITEFLVQLIEDPRFRLAGAEEALRQIIAWIEGVLAEREAEHKALAAGVAEVHQRLATVILGLGGRKADDTGSKKDEGGRKRDKEVPLRPLKLFPEEVVGLLCLYGERRCRCLLLRQALDVYVSLRGHLSDELREVNFCRVRLGELLQSWPAPGEDKTPPPAREPGSRALPGLIHGLNGQPETPPGEAAAAGAGSPVTLARCLYPPGCGSLEETLDRLLHGITAADLEQLDTRVQAMIRAQFLALVHVCLTSGNVLKPLQAAMQQEAETFLRERLGGTEVAELFLAQHPDDGDAAGELASAFAEAAPELARSLGSNPNEVALVAVPAGKSEETDRRLRDLARKALPAAEQVRTDGGDDLVVYREVAHVPLDELKQLGPAGQEAYRQMLALDSFTPHNRIDISFPAPT
jgi:serine/threonine protein kinase